MSTAEPQPTAIDLQAQLLETMKRLEAMDNAAAADQRTGAQALADVQKKLIDDLFNKRQVPPEMSALTQLLTANPRLIPAVTRYATDLLAKVNERLNALLNPGTTDPPGT